MNWNSFAILSSACAGIAYCITDEITKHILYEPATEHISMACLDGHARKRTIVINGMSKDLQREPVGEWDGRLLR